MTSPACERVGETEPGKSPGAQSISEPVAGCIPARERLLVERSSLLPGGRANVGPGATEWLAQRAWSVPVAVLQRPGLVSKRRGPPGLRPSWSCQEQERQTITTGGVPRRAKTRDVVLTPHDPCPRELKLAWARVSGTSVRWDAASE